jgi:hypothetical protein
LHLFIFLFVGDLIMLSAWDDGIADELERIRKEAVVDQ